MPHALKCFEALSRHTPWRSTIPPLACTKKKLTKRRNLKSFCAARQNVSKSFKICCAGLNPFLLCWDLCATLAASRISTDNQLFNASLDPTEIWRRTSQPPWDLRCWRLVCDLLRVEMHANGLLHLLKVHVHLGFLHALGVLVLLGLLPTAAPWAVARHRTARESPTFAIRIRLVGQLSRTGHKNGQHHIISSIHVHAYSQPDVVIGCSSVILACHSLLESDQISLRPFRKLRHPAKSQVLGRHYFQYANPMHTDKRWRKHVDTCWYMLIQYECCTSSIYSSTGTKVVWYSAPFHSTTACITLWFNRSPLDK